MMPGAGIRPLSRVAVVLTPQGVIHFPRVQRPLAAALKHSSLENTMPSLLLSRLRRLREHFAANPEAGQGLVEYGMILVLAVVMVFIVVTLLGPWVGNVFSNVVNFL